MSRYVLHVGSQTAQGARSNNEDRYVVDQVHHLFLVADGMGGHPEPKRAAQTAVSAARDYLFAPQRLEELVGRRFEPEGFMQKAIQHANARVRQLATAPGRAAHSVAAAPAASSWGTEKTPGCTLILAIVLDGRLAVANVGDGSIFLFREGRLLLLAGGEARRLGSRPEEYLGHSDHLEVEAAEQCAEEGDRVLLCTDGLTRYFGIGGAPSGQEGLERLQQVVGRISADPQALVSQLTADGRGELYDDDTTVVVAAIGSSRDAPDLLPPERARRREELQQSSAAPDPTPFHAAARPLLLPLGLLLALAVGVVIGTWHPWRRSPDNSLPPFQPFAAAPVDLSALPRGGVVLLQRGTDRLYVLRTRPVGTPASDESVTLSALRVLPAKVIKDTGNSYRLDVGRGRLIDPNGHGYAVSVDSSTGVIEIQQSATLKLYSRPAGLPIAIDGRSAGRTPAAIPVQAGRHQVQVRGPSGSDEVWDKPVEIPPRASFTLNLDLSPRNGSRTTRP